MAGGANFVVPARGAYEIAGPRRWRRILTAYFSRPSGCAEGPVPRNSERTLRHAEKPKRDRPRLGGRFALSLSFSLISCTSRSISSSRLSMCRSKSMWFMRRLQIFPSVILKGSL